MNITQEDFNLDKLNRPATAKEALERRVSPCAAHDRETLLCEEIQLKDNLYKQLKPRVFESGAIRDANDNKPYIHNLKGYTRQRFGYHMTIGANKYGDGNWTKGMPTPQYLESMDRHLAAYMEGDRSEDHLSAILFGINGIMQNEKNDGLKADYYFNLNKQNDTTK